MERKVKTHQSLLRKSQHFVTDTNLGVIRLDVNDSTEEFDTGEIYKIILNKFYQKATKMYSPVNYRATQLISTTYRP